jgi:hypothetical protein
MSYLEIPRTTAYPSLSLVPPKLQQPRGCRVIEIWRVIFRGIVPGILLLAVAGPNLVKGKQPATISFNRDVRPILSDHCFQCHGPDSGQRVSSLRLDTEEGLHGDPEDAPVLVPGNPGESQLWQRITSEDPDYRMPPEDDGRPLSNSQREILRRWIEQGAVWQPHWSFISPERPLVPDIPDEPSFATFPANQPLDRFILHQLHVLGLVPSPRASRATLLRRVTLDLTGLPPTPAELDAFLADNSPDAYERVVDRLLDSPAYGERMAIPWLDAARYSDTSGYQTDGPRDMWRWRDWVIQSLNANMPFDQFTTEQLAGDLLGNATLQQRIATGFHRNHRGNSEGGIIPEEYQVEYVVDRVATTGAVWLGLTLECARCHDHKYDPISQQEFYQLYAFFNNVPEHGRAVKEGNSPPYILAPTDEQQEQLDALDRELEAMSRAIPERDRQLANELAAWESRMDRNEELDWHYHDGLLARYPLDGEEFLSQAASPPNASQLETGSEPLQFVSARGGKAARFDGTSPWEAGDVGKFGYFDKFSVGAWIRPSEPTGTIVSRMTPEEQGDGYYLHLEQGRLQVNLIKRWLDDAIRVETRRTLELERWHHILFTYDGSRTAAGVRIYVNGQFEPCEVRLDALNQSFGVDQPLRIGGGHHGFTGAIQDVRIYDRCLGFEDAHAVAEDRRISRILAKPLDERTQAELTAVRHFFLDQHASADLRDWHNQWISMQRRRTAFVESLPTVMVMEEMETPRETHVLARGEYDKPTTRVEPGVPQCLPELRLPEFSHTRSDVNSEASVRADRLALARWLTDDRHPLTARVIVNRQWELFFGVGLVKTAEDFGVQGEAPSHPELLDWLACEFMERGWNLKRLHRDIVTSATYQQSSQVGAELVERDPENRWLARGPRFRLSAELLRDQALAFSGLMVSTIGGPSVKPYQPEGLWEEIASVGSYDQSRGADLYRRGLYSYWKRTVAPPSMMTFDATARETCLVQRTRTNTPLQALTLMNDVTFVEAARHLAVRVIKDGGETAEERLQYAFRLVTARLPQPSEMEVLVEGLARHRDHFRDQPEAAQALLAVGDSRSSDDADQVELAAYMVIMNLLLNLDEVITKG